MMTTAVAIPVFNGLVHLKHNLKAVLALKADEYIFTDDASTDGSPEYLAKYKKITVIPHQLNIGFTRSVNECFAHATTDIVFLLNQDVLPDKDLIKNTLPLFADSSIAAITFNEQNNHTWAQSKFVNGFIDYSNGPTHPANGGAHSSFWASGGSAAFRRSTWNEMGGFDPIFSPGYFEDLDLGYRLHKSGYNILWSPESKVTHTPETAFSEKYSPGSLVRIKERNLLLTHWKNLDSTYLVHHLFALLDRILTTPGFIVPTLMAISRLPQLKRRTYPVSDRAVFDKLHA